MNTHATIRLTPAAAELANALRDARALELALQADLTDQQLYGSPMRIIEPPIWELGHVGWFQERWILRNLDQSPPLRGDADSLYDSFNIPNAQRWDLGYPLRQETIAYINTVLDRSIERLHSRTPSPDDIYFYRLALYHEDMHTETMQHIRQTLGFPAPHFPNLSA